MNDYQREQLETLIEVHRRCRNLPLPEKKKLDGMMADYLSFRAETASFLSEHFSNICTRNCYENEISACCSREGIITFFADVAVNVLNSRDKEIEAMAAALQKANTGFKCVYLGQKGCLWHVKPVVCEMFLCDPAQKEVFGKNPGAGKMWKKLKKRQEEYTWPDRPVLFDALEEYFLEAGYTSPLMYLHNSPGLLRVKQKAGRRVQGAG
jgi:hypothetical protein